MNRWQSGSPRRGRYQVIDGLSGERLATFRDEEPGEAVRTGGQMALDCAEFIAGDRLFDGQSVLETPNPEAGLIEVDVVAAQADRLAHTQPMAVHHRHQQVIADAVTPPLGGLEQVRDLGLV